MDEVLEFLDKAEAAGQNVMSVIGSQVRAIVQDIKNEHTTAAVDSFLIIIMMIISSLPALNLISFVIAGRPLVLMPTSI